MNTRRPRMTESVLALLVFALLVASAQAGAAEPQPGKVKQTARPVQVLAMDWPRVAYMMSGRRVGVWNVATGATSLIKGNYPSNGRNFGYGSGEVAIAGKRVALITRFVIGNTMQTQERLYTASVDGSAHQLAKKTNHSSYSGDCTVPGTGGADGNWLGGLVGSGKVLAVSSWKANDESIPAGGRLSLILPTGLRTIATGPGAIVSRSADRGHIAVLRSTDAWPAYQGPLEQSTPMVGVYSTGGRLLHEIAPAVPPPNQACGSPTTNILGIALGGNQLAVLRLDAPQSGPLTRTFEVYDWTNGALVHTWAPQPKACNFAASGTLAVYSAGCGYLRGTQRLHVLDLATGKDVVIAHAPGSGGYITAMDSHGLVYSANPYAPKKEYGKLVFVPTAKVLAALSR